jgi:hypothetical protein
MGAGQKAALYIGGGVLTLALLCCGGAAIIGAVTGDPKPTAARQNAADAEAQAAPTTAAADPVTAAPSSAGPAASPAAPPPVVEKKTVTETQAIPFGTRRVNDAGLPKGTEKVRTAGVNGVKTLTYEVTLTDGVQTAKTLLSQKVTTAPVTRVIAVGTKKASQCDPNYSGCVPIASDVDCAGGSGNGPAYVRGPVQVIGTDIYDLDSDNDGVACE